MPTAEARAGGIQDFVPEKIQSNLQTAIDFINQVEDCMDQIYLEEVKCRRILAVQGERLGMDRGTVLLACINKSAIALGAMSYL